MERFQVENLYQANGLTNYRLRCAKDLLGCHGIDYQAIQGYELLTEEHKAMYESFIVKLFNGLGMDSKIGLIPTGIFFVEDTEYYAKKDDGDDYYMSVKRIIKSINKGGEKKTIHSYTYDEYENLEIVEQESKNYLRIEYKHFGSPEWLHIIENGNRWY